MQKPTTLIYCGEDGGAGKGLAASLRDGTTQVYLCSAGAFHDRAEMPCERVVFTNDVPEDLRQRILRAHGLADAPADLQRDPVACLETPREAAVIRRRRGRSRKVAA